jgi:hypothetical protein
VATYACTSHCSNIVWHCDSTILYCTSHFHICLSTTPTSGSPCTRASSAVFTVVSPATSEFEGQNLSWKQRYAEARGRWCQSVMYGQRFVDPQCYLRLLPRKMFTVTYLDSSLVRGEALLALATADRSLHDAAQKSEQDSDASHYFATMDTGVKRFPAVICIQGRVLKVAYSTGAGAIHSPSSRYRWKHR